MQRYKRKGVDKDKVRRLRKDGGRGPLKLDLGLKGASDWPVCRQLTMSMFIWWVERARPRPKLKARHLNDYLRRGDVEGCRRLCAIKCPADEWTCFWAAKGGHMDLLKYAH